MTRHKAKELEQLQVAEEQRKASEEKKRIAAEKRQEKRRTVEAFSKKIKRVVLKGPQPREQQEGRLAEEPSTTPKEPVQPIEQGLTPEQFITELVKELTDAAQKAQEEERKKIDSSLLRTLDKSFPECLKGNYEEDPLFKAHTEESKVLPKLQDY